MAQAQANLKSAKAGAERAHALQDIENFVARIPSEIGKYAICCFTFTPESVIAEDQFLHMTYNQDGAHNSNGNASVFDIIITKEYEVVDKDAMAPMPDKPKWHPGRAALEHNPYEPESNELLAALLARPGAAAAERPSGWQSSAPAAAEVASCSGSWSPPRPPAELALPAGCPEPGSRRAPAELLLINPFEEGCFHEDLKAGVRHDYHSCGQVGVVSK